MKLMKMLGLAVLIASSSVSFAAAPAAAPAAGVVTVGQVKAVTSLMEAMQMEKMMRTITSTSRYASEEQRTAAYAKLEKVPKEQIYARLAYPLAKVISVDTANEMARFYTSPYGQKLVYLMYNSKGTFGGSGAPTPSAAERKDMQRPELIKARKALADADTAIQHEGFLLLQAIAK